MRDNANPIAGGLSLGIVLHPEAATAAQPLQVLPVGAELALSPWQQRGWIYLRA